MNIFTALSQGRGSLNEENMSAMLGYLLSPEQSHGLNDVFLKKFLSSVAEIKDGQLHDLDNLLLSKDEIKVEVNFEQPYSYHGYSRYVDIDIRIFDNHYNELYRLIIENKIKPASSSSNQFKEEYEAVISDIEENSENSHPKVIMIFLTPTGRHSQLLNEYENLSQDMLGKNEKVWVYWADDENTITDLLRQILKDESEVKIDPITDYTKHTLKAFIRHIQETNIKYTSPGKVDHKPGGIVDFAYAKISDGYYKIEKYESTTIKVFNLDLQRYEVAKPILRKVNDEKNLGVNLYLSTNNERNTRSLGNMVIKKLKQQNKDDKPSNDDL
ncbi:hypothetical protein Metev_0458 [Methanohalobium evestigatum Z-7303]|uniref:PD-(D/E)XK nuclease superfamily protein n=1 Tax=Methanohalobium evestigatum (strain ATCC BAA-1072 / DSM 3721 / NBRC 107634 / OCM 161 / Z-7303) TaxID=644295 RepID=D7E831_METEZ|nr:PD-(D/E)XK nuclease family protein [Methanohalobium evestigatum]ADI73373.1 hypothetical protein Metev_0458 [Methanohalobium evestigatum Z-7303]